MSRLENERSEILATKKIIDGLIKRKGIQAISF